jgi:hypothetical protein
VAQGSLEELRAGAGRRAQANRGEEANIEEQTGLRNERKRSLEEIFLEVVGTDRTGNPAAAAPEQELSWLS